MAPPERSGWSDWRGSNGTPALAETPRREVWYNDPSGLMGTREGVEPGVRPEEIPLLAAIDRDTRERTLAMRRYAAGDRVFAQGGVTTGLWIMLQGRCATERVAVDGTITVTGVWVPGDIVGIAGLWDGSGYPAAARALDTPTRLAWIDRRSALALHQAIPAFGFEISRLLAERLRMVQEAMANRQGRPVGQQLAAILLMLDRRMGPALLLTHEDLAHMIGTHRETVNRALQEFFRSGALELRYGQITVTDRNVLAQWAGIGEDLG